MKNKKKTWERKFISWLGLWRPYFYKDKIDKKDIPELKDFINQTIKEEIQTAFNEVLDIEIHNVCRKCKNTIIDISKIIKLNIKFYLKRYDK